MDGTNEPIGSREYAPSAAVGSGTTRTDRNARKEKPLTLERLKELLTYDPETGNFIRKPRNHRDTLRRPIMGSKSPYGYTIIKIDQVRYFAHRLVWFWCYGVFPSGDLDHRNHNRQDNRIENLREATRMENARNRSVPRNVTSMYKGVGGHSQHNMWRARIIVEGKEIHLGLFRNQKEAASAYDTAAKRYYKDFASLNFDELEYL